MLHVYLTYMLAYVSECAVTTENRDIVGVG